MLNEMYSGANVLDDLQQEKSSARKIMQNLVN